MSDLKAGRQFEGQVLSADASLYGKAKKTKPQENAAGSGGRTLER